MPSVRLRSRSVLLVSLVLLGFGIGILRIDVFQNNQERYFLDSSLGKTIQIEGIVVEEPDVREEYTNIVLESAVSRLVGEAGVLDEKTKILARIPVYPEFAYGDELSLFGKITVPKNFNSEDGARPFDYRSYLAKDGIYYQMYFPKVSVVSHNKGNAVREKLFTLKRWFMENIADGIAEPEASLASGITLGAKQSLGDDLIQKFRETGVAHIVVLSGYNIAVVAGIFSRVVMFMPFSLRLIVSALGIVLFAMMVGGGATVVRATAMALVVILARMLGREGDALRVLVLVGGLMVFVNPMILLHDVSFQLSFSATLAIVTLVPIFEKYFLFIKNFMLREIVVTTFATQVFVLPLILYHMGSVSLVGFVANIFILPVVPLAMLFVGLVAVLWWVPFFGALVSVMAYFLLAYIVTLVELFAQVPFASLHNISFPLFLLSVTYALLGFYISKNYPRKNFTQNI
ncbi:MAG: ComEC family competence protein [Candidatus Yonathbacteria bacterium]|nr:ComEC family competence protein [Candidatus Yonathbacteria bacterium]